MLGEEAGEILVLALGPVELVRHARRLGAQPGHLRGASDPFLDQGAALAEEDFLEEMGAALDRICGE